MGSLLGIALMSSESGTTARRNSPSAAASALSLSIRRNCTKAPLFAGPVVGRVAADVVVGSVVDLLMDFLAASMSASVSSYGSGSERITSSTAVLAPAV